MKCISIYDKEGRTAKKIAEMDLWKSDNNFQVNLDILNDNKNIIKDIKKARPDILIVVADGDYETSPEGIKNIYDNFLGINIIVIGYDTRGKTVREYFINGAFDYLIEPIDSEMISQSMFRIYSGLGLNYVVNDLQLKVDALIDNIFLGGGQEKYIITSIIDQIYNDWDKDPINCQVIADKAKKHIYEILIERKTWLEKFLYRNDFTYQFGFSLRTKKEIVEDWTRCFKEASAIVTKYQMIDDKLVYNIGKYVVVHVDEKLSLDKVAKGVFLNPSYVSHIFKKVTNMSFSNYLAEVKVDRAKVLLRDNNIKIRDVARIVGYDNPEYFTKIFRKKIGCTPIDYQAMLYKKI